MAVRESSKPAALCHQKTNHIKTNHINKKRRKLKDVLCTRRHERVRIL